VQLPWHFRPFLQGKVNHVVFAIVAGGVYLPFQLGQVGDQVVDKSAVAGEEGLGLGRGGITHYADAVGVRLEGYDFGVAYPEPFYVSGKVDVFGGNS
jgi:hypothetical protein